MIDDVAERCARIWAQLDESSRAELLDIEAAEGHAEPSAEPVAALGRARGIVTQLSWEGAPGNAVTLLESGFMLWIDHHR